jgi:hypothetical protein
MPQEEKPSAEVSNMEPVVEKKKAVRRKRQA